MTDAEKPLRLSTIRLMAQDDSNSIVQYLAKEVVRLTDATPLPSAEEVREACAKELENIGGRRNRYGARRIRSLDLSRKEKA